MEFIDFGKMIYLLFVGIGLFSFNALYCIYLFENY